MTIPIKRIFFTVLLFSGFHVYAQQNVPVNQMKPVATPVALPTPYSNPVLNYVRTWEPVVPIKDTALVVNPGKTIAEVKQLTAYFDGLGRPLQTVAKGSSGSGKDMVSPVIYDEYGREVYKYLPYAATATAANGLFKNNPFGDQQVFYNNRSLNPGILGDTIYYSQTTYENSPLNRILSTNAPGNNWAASGGKKAVTTQYLLNEVADAVVIWKLQGNGIPVYNGKYDAGSLFKYLTTDEEGKRVVTFKDKDDHVILKKVQLQNAPGNAHAGWLCTYYIYDDLGLLTFVIPPLAMEKIDGTWDVTAYKDELCFQYRYDSHQRMIEKKIPGAGLVEMVYDNRDRLVFSQDGNMRDKGKWMVTFYDGMNRPVETAIYKPLNRIARAALQTNMDKVAADGVLSYTIPGIDKLLVATNDRVVYEAISEIDILPGYESGNEEQLFQLNSGLNGGVINTNISNPLPNIASSELTPLTFTFYDNYDYVKPLDLQSGDFSKLNAGTSNAGEESKVSYNVAGLVTGMRKRIIDTDTWLTTTTYYDEKARVIQSVSDNQTGGKDVVSTMYDFTAKPLSVYERHTNLKSGVSPQLTVLSVYNYDPAGRLIELRKKYNDQDTLTRVIAANSYDELGALRQHALGGQGSGRPITTETFEYNIRGWLLSMNRAYVESGTMDKAYFGQVLSYDGGFSGKNYNGNIAGIKWRGFTDPAARAFGYSYDNASRLINGDFSQQEGSNSTWNNNSVNFNVSDITYDANGNIGSMKQMGLVGNQSVPVDVLSYTYQGGSNKLLSVKDNGGTSAPLGDFKNGTNEGVDYVYDVNGNLTQDANKNIDSIDYNHLNLPVEITITGKGIIRYKYDATGAKISKTVIDNSGGASRTTVTDYIGGLVYENDSLRFAGNEEGRVRVINKAGAAPQYVFDYFIKDHLGNIRQVLTEESNTNLYAATMESGKAATEEALFSNIASTRAPLPAGYPTDGTTNPNQYISKLNAGSGAKVGASLVLRVMAGDTLKVAGSAFYKSTGTNVNNATPAQMLASVLNAFGGTDAVGGAHGAGTSSMNLSSNFSSSDLQHLIDKDPGQNLSDKPKAYITYAAFDDQFKLIDENSGVRQVQGAPDQLQVLGSGNIIMKKSGFVYIYTSNESNEDVYFDNLAVTHATGPVIEETHYYPFGLTMAGISATALKGTQYSKNRNEFNGIEHTTDLDLNQYDALYRNLDPQVGRWWQIDPKATKYEDYSPYNHTMNNPIGMSDMFGDDTTRYQDLPKVWSDFKPNSDVVQLPTYAVSPSSTHQDWSNVGFGITYGFGWKVMPSQGLFKTLIFGGRSLYGRDVDLDGRLTKRITPLAFIVPEELAFVDFEGINLVASGRRILKTFKWSSKSVSLAAKEIASGKLSIFVKTRAEAEELFLGLFNGAGYKNSSAFNGPAAKQYFNSKTMHYHWDDVFDETGWLVNHSRSNPHGNIMHLQVHLEDGGVLRIFFE
ncbi:DUF6443 domain-containing protein [Chitinophaga sp. Cy-1792]|uniref:DUF6443 domain-containing protein n=1 Tax=Chitinophaga sp. Cy-1792 TaxID=2608339 RepID=UPI0014232E65|nr:DUF6443 domain-containing protein [Chitinophaga sp. Cy-1792]NIG53531.1 hypothetical protein [Chitinophaga sp. Cy-1792]